jgi:hypothetical protein
MSKVPEKPESVAEKLRRDLEAGAAADLVDRLDPTLREWTQFDDPIED